jgi:ribA/ribD-fused uncharacterized protein
MITKFRGEYNWLSNFYKCEKPVYLGDSDIAPYPTVEHAYQAAKTFDMGFRTQIRLGDAVHAKRFFKTRKEFIRPDWGQVKLSIMEICLRQKFAQGTKLREKLLATGDVEIVEGNTWGDTFWGQCPIGTGENHLGKLLMKLREEFKK